MAVVSKSDLGPSVSPAWVLLGIPAGLLATFDPDGSGVWRAIAWVAVGLWRLPHVATVVGWVAVVLGVVGVVLLGAWVWRRWGR